MNRRCSSVNLNKQTNKQKVTQLQEERLNTLYVTLVSHSDFNSSDIYKG